MKKCLLVLPILLVGCTIASPGGWRFVGGSASDAIAKIVETLDANGQPVTTLWIYASNAGFGNQKLDAAALGWEQRDENDAYTNLFANVEGLSQTTDIPEGTLAVAKLLETYFGGNVGAILKIIAENAEGLAAGTDVVIRGDPARGPGNDGNGNIVITQEVLQQLLDMAVINALEEDDDDGDDG